MFNFGLQFYLKSIGVIAVIVFVTVIVMSYNSAISENVSLKRDKEILTENIRQMNELKELMDRISKNQLVILEENRKILFDTQRQFESEKEQNFRDPGANDPAPEVYKRFFERIK